VTKWHLTGRSRRTSVFSVIIPPMSHTLTAFIYHRRCIILASESLKKHISFFSLLTVSLTARKFKSLLRLTLQNVAVTIHTLTKKLCIAAHKTVVFRMDLRKNSDYFPLRHYLITFYNRNAVCLQRSGSCAFSYNTG
jgi:hypothetical protein